jgi:hypothetical protein
MLSDGREARTVNGVRRQEAKTQARLFLRGLGSVGPVFAAGRRRQGPDELGGRKPARFAEAATYRQLKPEQFRQV